MEKWRGEQKEYDQACKAFNQHLTPHFLYFHVLWYPAFCFISFIFCTGLAPGHTRKIGTWLQGRELTTTGVMLRRENRKIRLFWDLATGNGDNHPVAVRKLQQARQRN